MDWNEARVGGGAATYYETIARLYVQYRSGGRFGPGVACEKAIEETDELFATIKKHLNRIPPPRAED